jgi:hypothetical protein
MGGGGGSDSGSGGGGNGLETSRFAFATAQDGTGAAAAAAGTLQAGVEATERGFRCRIAVPAAFYGKLIGKGGEAKKRLEQQVRRCRSYAGSHFGSRYCVKLKRCR